MRYLTPVGIREKFVASGTHTCYVPQPYSETQSPSGVVEYWSIHELPDQMRIIRGDRQAHKADSDMQVLATMVQAAFGQTERMDMRVYVGPELAAEARYIFFDDHVEISHRTREHHEAEDEREHTEMALPASYRVDFGRITISRGFIVRAALSRASGEPGTQAAHGRIPVFSPHFPGGHELLHQLRDVLKGKLAYYAAEPVESTPFQVGHSTLTGQRCRIIVEDEDGGYRYTGIIDDQGIMLEDGTGCVSRLTQYAVRPEGLLRDEHC